MEKMNSEAFSPKAFLRSRRPERFSDTISKEVANLDRSLLEFHLDSLTSRSQEADFERFARRLCEREICPNLLPQTGPTGGGDSKVDSETYPVADNLALIWYRGVGQEASNERWAFAFSAKADWRPKVQSDVRKIAETSREYKKAFFVTNQSVPDRKRAEVEDSLRTRYNTDVRVLDRTWILDRVFLGEHETIAIDELGIKALTHRRIVKGPRDVKREEELNELEKQIQEAIQIGRINRSLVDDVLDAADLARNLERPRAEIEGRYHRANQMAQKYGSLRQKVEAAYQWAWTLYFWFEDYDAFSDQYALVEELITASRNAYDLEQLANLWHCLFTSVRCELLDFQVSNYQARTENLLSELERLRDEEDRPSTSLQAETLYIQVQMARRVANKKSSEDLLDALRDVVLRSKGLVGYPLEPLVYILTEIGSVFEGLATYDTLFETIVDVTSARDGEVRAARMLLIRGEQQINQGRNVEAIATLGRALRLLYKNETRYDVVRALYLCGYAYGEVGLLWAARGTLLSAASIATNEYWQYEDVTFYQAACYRHLKWVELLLGRFPYILSWHELDMAVCHILVDHGYDLETLLTTDSSFEIFFGRLLLRTEFSDLKYLVTLPDMLDQLGLDLASDALLYVLGHEERLEKTCQDLGCDPSYFASQWRNVESDRSLPGYLELYNRQKVVLRSRILGCQIMITSQNKPPCIEIAESLLAALESLLATTIINQAMAREPKLTVDVRVSDFAKFPMQFDLEEKAGRPHLVIRCRSFNPHKTGLEEQGQIKEALLELTITVLTQIVFFRDYEQDLKVLLHNERALERAIDFTGTFGTQANVLGQSPKTRLSAWKDDAVQTYPLLRSGPWEPMEIEGGSEGDEKSTTSPKITSQEPPPELLDPNLLKHDEMETVSLIRERLWERAGWSGVAFMLDPTNEYPPVFALIFKNREAGREIFVQWRKELGRADIQEQLRLTIVKGIDLAHPYAYRVIIGSNPMLLPTDNKLILFINRIHKMDATTPDNLNRFVESCSVVGAFIVAPAFVPPEFDGSQVPEFETKLGIGIHSINVREAWEIGPGDIDSMGIRKGDTPIVPEGIEKAPVHDLLKNL
jgi:tetratricopeptide (TPR) repeat protein